jgi:hypothetical protein
MFLITWVFDRLGYMPKIDMQVGKINFEPKIPDLEKPKAAVKKTRALPSRATVAKTAARKTMPKKAK